MEGGEIFGAFFSKQVPFKEKVLILANIECCPKFAKYAPLYIANTCQ